MTTPRKKERTTGASKDAPRSPDDAGSGQESTWPAELAPPSGVGEDLLSHPRGFREAAARLTALLLRRHGPDSLQDVEDAVQEAFAAAARTWSLQGTPDAPMAWLTRVAQRRYLDLARSRRRLVLDDDAIRDAVAPDTAPSPTFDTTDALDETLQLLFLCCHPALSRESRVALTLRHVSQLNVEEIARLLRAEPTAVAQRLTRAKRTLRDQRATFVLPSAADLPTRLDDVLMVCYAMFTEGHLPASGENIMRPELCTEALRLVEQLRRWPPTAQPVTHALAALCWLTMARFPARDDAGSVLPLEHQDRSKWDVRCIGRGMAAFARATGGTQLSRYHIEAHIALLHVTAPSYADTPWPHIVAEYERLLTQAPSPAAHLAHVVALAESGRMRDAIQALEVLAPSIGHWAEWHATAARLALAEGDVARAVHEYDAALTSPVAAPVRAYWMAQRASAIERLASASGIPQSTVHPAAPTTPSPVI